MIVRLDAGGLAVSNRYEIHRGDAENAGTDKMKPHILTISVLLLISTALRITRAEVSGFSIKQTNAAVTVTTAEGKPVLTYRLRPPADSKLSVQSGCYFDEVTTPDGVVVTQVAPPDHPHHRGIFLGWVEMHGPKDADFWGWGEPAPTKGRKIVNRAVEHVSNSDRDASFVAQNQWLADDVVMMNERLEARAHAVEHAYILDLTYTLTPPADVRLARWAFGGFCVRIPKVGTLVTSGPKGPIDLPDPSHLKPESDWP